MLHPAPPEGGEGGGGRSGGYGGIRVVIGWYIDDLPVGGGVCSFRVWVAI